eukprot:gnl/MRDRNA2_/MRDRNA2_96437_c0_seq1.p1 gnl/MRDRNA2_/MRDRNA2_96437_c0~~gnl/MRDRNA2_/MRDRNA2_96437_c0_seq1.p1  ORF type:complete len:103 (+),score=29.81 gnl/MRDRNA2_/MRDRNA2_96437_c0_seq1:58-366(+)
MSLRFIIIALLSSYVASELKIKKEDALLIDHLWAKLVPDGGQYMTKDHVFNLVAKVRPDEDLTDKHWEVVWRSVGADPEKGLTKEQLQKIVAMITAEEEGEL